MEVAAVTTGEYLQDGPDSAQAWLILAHGAGAGMDSEFMNEIAHQLGESGTRVIRFNFPYMVQRALSGSRRPPDRAPILLDCWRSVIRDIRDIHNGRLFIGGKSMGGRMASMIADEMKVDGLICLGYPFHPPGKPEKLRTEHLQTLHTPALFCQGERDTLGRRDEVDHYVLSGQISFHWLQDGDHSFKPRKASGLTETQNRQAAAVSIIQFMDNIA
ncbi:MAG: alpha/beta family hydrolase [Candidatus Sedimenticola sp. 6PFRAG1]